jgi:outer membrane autotransporter protein
MRVRSRILSGVSLISMLAAVSAVGPATAADTLSGPTVYDPYVNAETDSVTIDQDATIQADATTNDSFFNNLSMSDAGANLTIDDSFLLGDIVNQGTMSGGANAIDIIADSQVDGALVNTGLIEGATDGIFIDDNSTIGGGINNSGTITGGSTAIFLGDDSEILGGITNSGLIEGAVGINVADAEAELHGGISNSATGIIRGTTTAAIQFNGAVLTGGITNSGLIDGTGIANGINILGGTITGGITNNASGVIQVAGSSVTAIIVRDTTFNGNITNDGQILAEGTSAFGVIISGTTAFTGDITNSATGTISADLTAVLLSNTTFTGNISNSGTIESAATDGVNISATTFTGNFTNEAGGVITGGNDGVYLNGTTFTGNFVNSGTITGLSSSGVYFDLTTFTGNVTNNGVIAGPSGNGLTVALGTTIDGNITNSATGIITALSQGIAIDGIVTGILTNEGLIDPSTGISVTGQVDGGIVNSGTILATVAGIDLAGADTATTITQTAGLIRGRTADDLTITTALDLDQGVEVDDTVNLNGGEIDGDIVGGGADDVIVGGDVALRRGSVDGLDQFDVDSGRALLGTQIRGTDGEGLSVTNVDSMTVTAGTVYLDDDTTVDIVNDYTQGGEGTAEFFLTTDTATHGQINAGGNANLDGDLIAVIDGADFASVGGDTFTYQDIITGSISGTFANVSTTSIFFDAEAIYGVGFVDLELLRQGFADALILPGLTQNQQAVGGALEDIYNGALYGPDFEDLFNHLLSLPVGHEEEVAHIYDELAGAEHADIQEIGLRVSHAFNDAIGERMDDMKSAHGDKMAGLGLRRYADAGTSANDGEPMRRRHSAQERMGISVWGRGYGAWTKADGDAEAAGYDQDTGGFAGGLDVAVDHNWNVGGAIGWSTSDVEFATAGDEADVDSFQFAGYAAYESGRYYGDAVVSFGFHDVTSVRLIDLGYDTFIANAAYDAGTFGIHGEFGAVFDGGRVDVTPFIALGYLSNSTDGFSESGAGDFGLLVGDSDADSLTSTLGMRFSGMWRAGGVRLIPDAEIAWRHEFLDERQGFSATFIEDPSTPFSIVSSALSRDSALVNVGLGAQVSKNFVLFLDYNGVVNSAANTHTASAGLRATW